MALMQNGYETRNAINGVSQQLASCCCDVREQISGVNYNLSQGFAGVNYNMAKNTCDIIQAGHNDTQRIVDLITAQSIEAKNQKIADQANEINALRLKASQEAQNTYLVNALRPTPVPAYSTPNPFCCYNTCGGCTSAQ